MLRSQTVGWSLLVLLCSSSVLHTIALAHPQNHQPQYVSAQDGFIPSPVAQLPDVRIERKFAEKPNAMKKVALDEIDDIQTNQIQEGGFSWSNMLAMVMQMIFNPGHATGPNKSEGLDDNTIAPSPWANLLSVGLKILTAILGGGASNDGIDKVDNGSPLQGILAAVLSALIGSKDPEQVNTIAKQAGEFINIVVNLLDALKTSFSHRSIAARNLGRKDSISDAAVAGIAMLKTYVRSMVTAEDKCLQKYVCEANEECSKDLGGSSLFCQLGTYATSYVLEKTSGSTFTKMYEAGRRGRSGDNCRQIYLECNEV